MSKINLTFGKSLQNINFIIGSDHAGYDMKADLKEFLHIHFEQEFHRKNYSIHDVGCWEKKQVDYPDISKLVCENIQTVNDVGILICGTGQGMAMSANRHPHIRAGVAWNEEIAKMMREHNNANVLCLPARYMTSQEMEKIVETFITTSFSDEERHLRRISLF